MISPSDPMPTTLGEAAAAAALIVISVLAVRSATGGSIRIAGLPEFFLGAVFFGFMEVGILSLCVTTAWTTLYCALAHRSVGHQAN